MFAKRNTEMKKYGVSYTIKHDADHSNAITIGQDRVKIHWCNDLPQFKSTFGSHKLISATEKSRIVTIERIGNLAIPLVISVTYCLLLKDSATKFK